MSFPLAVNTLPIWVVRTVFRGDPLLLVLVLVVVAGMLLRLLWDPREDRFWLMATSAALGVPVLPLLLVECLMDESCA